MTPEERLLALELEIIASTAGGFLDAVDQIKKLLALESPEVRRRILALTAPNISAPVLRALADAFQLGIDEALADVGRARKMTPAEAVRYRRKALATGISPEATDAVVGLTAAARDAMATTKRLLNAGVDIDTAVAPLLAVANEIDRNLVTAINAASNDGVRATSLAAGLELVWESERDACIHCLAYSGQVSKTGVFPEGLSFAAKPLKTPGRPKCPLHPRCRCRLRPLFDKSYAEALRRESIRSILRGYSLPSESMKARVDAAERLINSGVNAPASVIRDGKRAVKAGKFPSRVPGGG